jgi:hypothetical protein
VWTSAQQGLVFVPGPQSSYSCVACSWMKDAYHHAQLFIDWDGVSWSFCLGWPQTMILLIIASLGTRHETTRLA